MLCNIAGNLVPSLKQYCLALVVMSDTGGGTPVIDAQSVDFSYGRRQVLSGLSLQVARGEVFGILGANGAGKTTFIRMLVGLLRPRSGRLHVLGERPSSRQASRVGYMPQLSALYQELTVEHNVSFFARMYGMSDRPARSEAVEAALNLVGLWERRKDAVLDLSGGMRQRLSLAIALVHGPSLLLLDEPTVGLDPELRASFWEHFRGMAAGGTTLVISSHTMDDAAHCDRLGFLQEGRVVAQGSPAELRASAGADATLEDAFLYYVRRG